MLKETDTREKAVMVGTRRKWGRVVAPWPLPPPSSSSSSLFSLVSSSLTRRGDPSFIIRTSLTSFAFCWAFETADANACCLKRKQTPLLEMLHFTHKKEVYPGITVLWVDMCAFYTSFDSDTESCGSNVVFPHTHYSPVSPAKHCTLAPYYQNLRKWAGPVGTSLSFTAHHT